MNNIKRKFTRTEVVPVGPAPEEGMVTSPNGKPKDLTWMEVMKLVGLKEYIIASNTLMHMDYAPPTEIRERCKNTWGTMGVVSALLAGLSVIPPLTSQSTVGLSTGTDAWAVSNWLTALLYLSFMAFICNLTVIIASTLFYIFIDHVFTDEHLLDYLDDFKVSMVILPIVFGLSITLVGAEILVVIGYTCRSYHVWILMGLAGGMWLLLFRMTMILCTWTGGRCANIHLRKLHGPQWPDRFRKVDEAV